MENNQLWQKFYHSGKVEHYLEYVKKAGRDNGADKDQGTDIEGTQS